LAPPPPPAAGGALASLCGCVSAACAALGRVEAACDARYNAARDANDDAATAAALRRSLRAQLSEARAECLAGLEAGLGWGQAGAAPPATATPLAALAAARALAARAAALAPAAAAAGPGLSPAARLDGLWASCGRAELGRDSGTALRCALRAFIDALQPLCAALQALLARGGLEPPPLAAALSAEWPLRNGPGADAGRARPAGGLGGNADDAQRFWAAGLEAAECPAFLKPLLPSLLLAAKSRRLLRLAGLPAGGPAEGGESESGEDWLFQDFCARLLAALGQAAEAGEAAEGAGEEAAAAQHLPLPPPLAAPPAPPAGAAAAARRPLLPPPAAADLSALLRAVGSGASPALQAAPPATAAPPSAALHAALRRPLRLPPPAAELLHASLLRPLLARCRAAAAEAAAAMLAPPAAGGWGLLRELEALQALFLGAAPGFAASLCERLGQGGGWRGAQAALQASLQQWAGCEAALEGLAERVYVVPGEAAGVAGGAPEPLAGARLLLRLPWPIGLIAPAGDIEAYAALLGRLLSLRRVRGALEEAAAGRRKRRGGPARERTRGVVAAAAQQLAAAAAPRRVSAEVLEARALCVCAVLSEHIAACVLQPAIGRLAAELAASPHLDAQRAAHAQFLARAQRGAWLGGAAGALGPAAQRLLAAAHACAAGGEAAAAARQLSFASHEFSRLLRRAAARGGPEAAEEEEALAARLEPLLLAIE